MQLTLLWVPNPLKIPAPKKAPMRRKYRRFQVVLRIPSPLAGEKDRSTFFLKKSESCIKGHWWVWFMMHFSIICKNCMSNVVLVYIARCLLWSICVIIYISALLYIHLVSLLEFQCYRITLRPKVPRFIIALQSVRYVRRKHSSF